MSLDIRRPKLVLYRPGLLPVFERLSTAPMKPLNPEFVPKLSRPRLKRGELSEDTIRELPPSVSHLYTTFSLAKNKLRRAMKAQTEAVSKICSNDTSYDADLKEALRTCCYEKLIENPSPERHSSTPSLVRRKLKKKIVKRKAIKIEHSYSQVIPRMLLSSSESNDSRTSTATGIPAYIMLDENEVSELSDSKTTGRMSRIPSLRDYPARRFKVELTESFMTKLSNDKAYPHKITLTDPNAPRPVSSFKGSRVKTAPHAPFRPVADRELTPNHFKRAVPRSKLS